MVWNPELHMTTMPRIKVDQRRPWNHLLTLPNSESIFTKLIFLHVCRKRSWYMPLNICWYFLIKLSWYLGFNFFWYCWLKICWYLGLNICGVDFCSIFDDICWSNFVDIFGSIFADGDFAPYLGEAELIFAAQYLLIFVAQTLLIFLAQYLLMEILFHIWSWYLPPGSVEITAAPGSPLLATLSRPCKYNSYRIQMQTKN